MKQIIQDLKDGSTILEDVPVPQVKSGHALIQTTRSLVSLGTERMLVEFGKAGFIAKARQQPEKVKQVLDKVKTDGLIPTMEAVFNKLGQPLPLGYCNVGRVLSVGKGVRSIKVGDRVVSNGNHAEIVCVPENLVALIPDIVSDEEAAFTVIGSIGLQGIRLCAPQLGETIVVVGLGLIGLMVAQLLLSNGCRVVGIEFDQTKLDIAASYGVIPVNPSQGTDSVKYVEELTGGVGADGVIITASSKGNEVIHDACQMSRKRGRIILIGVIGLNMMRSDFYEKELTFQVSCSYGAGRYDDEYEKKGHDYPIAYVRWTEKRNFEAILQLISQRRLNVTPLITERVPLDRYLDIYGDMRKTGSIASILEYADNVNLSSTIVVMPYKPLVASHGAMGVIGAGNFTASTIMPNLIKSHAPVKCIVSAGGLSAKILAKRFKVNEAGSDYKTVLSDESIGMVLITTRHDLHARMVTEALHSGKHVFVEKPLALNEEQLQSIESAYRALNGQKMVMVGFNRRFSPLAVKMKNALGEGPKNIVATMNAGAIPRNVWVQDMEVGGGRIIGEACHYIDLCSYLTGSKIVSVCMNALGMSPEENTDNASILLKYEDGSNAVINYFSNGSKEYSKERIEAYCQEKIAIIDNWRILSGYGIKNFKTLKTRMDKGHRSQFAQVAQFLSEGGLPPISFESIINTTRASFAVIESLKIGQWIHIQ